MVAFDFACDLLKLSTPASVALGVRPVVQIQEELKRANELSTSSGTEPTTQEKEQSISLTAEQRAEKMKEKNKMAQKRFRERTKQRVEERQQEVAALSKSLRELEIQKRKLQGETNELLKQQQSSSSSVSISGLPNLKEVEVDFIPATSSWSGFNPAGRGGIILQALFGGRSRKLTHEQALKLSMLDHCKIWREMVFQCGQLLLENPEEDINSEAGRKLKELLSERHGLACYIACWTPRINSRLYSINLTDPRLDAPRPDAAFHREVVRKLGLSDRQKRALCQAYKTYLAKFQMLLRQREELQAKIMRADPIEENQVGCPLLVTNMEYRQNVRLLQENIDAEHVCRSVFWGTIFHIRDGLTFFQEAKYLLASWPCVPPMVPDVAVQCTVRYSPDPFSLLGQLSRELDEADAQDQSAPQVKLEADSCDLYESIRNKTVGSLLSTHFVGYLPGAELSFECSKLSA